MSTILNKEFDYGQDAMTVVIDYRREEARDTFDEELKKFFEPEELLYLYEEELSGRAAPGNELIRIISERSQKGEIRIPEQERMVFCHILEIGELNCDWTEEFFEIARRAGQIGKRLEALDRHHILCLVYRSDHPTAKKEETFFAALKELGERSPEISRWMYLLRAEGFKAWQELQQQERALSMILYMFSRKDYYRASYIPQRSDFRFFLKLIGYVEYMGNETLPEPSEIQELREWLENPEDPELVDFFSALRSTIQSEGVEVRKASGRFERYIPLFPVNIRDVKKHFLKGYTSLISENHPVIARNRKQFIRSAIEQSAADATLERALEIVKTEMHYPDIQCVKQMMEDGSLQSRIMDSLEPKYRTEEIREMAAMVTERLLESLKELLPEMEQERDEKEKILREQQEKSRRVQTYKNLEDCLRRIHTDQAFKISGGLSKQNEYYIAAVSGKSAEEWEERKYTIDGIDQIFQNEKIEPCAFALLKEYEVVNLRSEQMRAQMEKLVI